MTFDRAQTPCAATRTRSQPSEGDLAARAKDATLVRTRTAQSGRVAVEVWGPRSAVPMSACSMLVYPAHAHSSTEPSLRAHRNAPEDAS